MAMPTTPARTKAERHAVFDEDTGEQLSGWMSGPDVREWLACANYTQEMPSWQDRKRTMRIWPPLSDLEAPQ
jgi:hypothetical protein